MSTATRYVITAVVAVLIGASCNLDGPDETITEALVQADKADAVAAARRAADPRIAAATGDAQ